LARHFHYCPGRISLIIVLFSLFPLLVLLLFPSLILAAEAPQPALAMHGTPAYATGFSHFRYANPDAPKGGTLRLGVVGSFDSLQPFIIRGTTPQIPGFGLQGTVYETLMVRGWDEPFTLYGLLAESVTVADDRSAVTFTLNPQARWQDGQPVTAADVLFSFETLRREGRPNHRTYYKKVAKAEQLDERRVRFSFLPNDQGVIDREMPLIMGLMPVLPRHAWAGRTFNATTLQPPLGSGPYRVTKVEPGRHLVLERNSDYWGRDLAVQRGFYNFDRVEVDFYRDDSIALQAFKAGQFDIRREPDPNKWATGYDSAALSDGRVALTRFAHQRTEAAYGLILNTRRPLLQDRSLRQALGLAFDFEWLNRSLFHGAYRRTTSFFPNSELAATGLPQGRELELLNQYRQQLPPETFTTDLTTEATQPQRMRLLQASTLLKQAGYVMHDGALLTPAGQPVTLEVMLSDPAEEKVALEWARNLKRLGITASIRSIDSAQFQARLTNFDYDVTTGRWFNSLSPGNEQLFFWGSAAAKQPGSRNYAGIADPVIDALASAIPNAATRTELVAATRALDRALLAGHYVIPFYYLGADQIAVWQSRIAHPEAIPRYGPILETWWSNSLPTRN